MVRVPLFLSLLVAAACVKPGAYECSIDRDCGAGARCEAGGVCVPVDADPPGPDAAPDARSYTPTARDECMEGVKLSTDHSACAEAVCAKQPACCTLAWTQTCVLAVELEPTCARSCSGAVFSSHGGGVGIVPADGSTGWTQQDLGTGDTYHAAPADYDADGDLDVAYVTIDGWGLRRNDGSGNLARVAGDVVPRYLGRHAVWGDWDGDGDLDLAIGGRRGAMNQSDPAHSLWLVTNTGSGLALAATPIYTGDDIIQLERGDLDGDGDLDLVAGSWLGPAHALFLINDGQGNFTRRPNTTIDATEGVRLCQLAGDPLPELIVSGSAYLRVYPNQGGSFLPDRLLSVSGVDLVETHCGDLDGDGDLDLAASGWSEGPIQVYRNDGGSFSTTPAWSVTTSIESWSLDLGDVDGDRDLDLVVQGSGGPRLYRNTTASPSGPITFAEPAQLTIAGGFNHHGLELAPRP